MKQPKPKHTVTRTPKPSEVESKELPEYVPPNRITLISESQEAKPIINIDDLCEMIINGDGYKAIAEHYGISRSTLHKFLTDESFSARVKQALQISADSYTDKAERVLLDAEANLIEMSRARELAQHYRWKASKRNPKAYGDRMEVDHTLSDRRKEIGDIFTPLEG